MERLVHYGLTTWLAFGLMVFGAALISVGVANRAWYHARQIYKQVLATND